jgi:xanthine permease XanP
MENKSVVYGLEARPPFFTSLVGAIQHVLASFIGVITPTLIIGGVLGLGSEIPYLISMALIVSGVATFIQARRIGPVGSGLLSLQGTSFAFLSSIIAAGFIAKAKGGGPDEIMALIVGVCFLGAFIEIILSQALPYLKKVITPTVTGIVITTIGIYLIRAGITDFAGGFGAKDIGSYSNLFLGSLVLVIILALTLVRNTTVRVSSVFIGIIVGYIVAIFMGKVDFSALGTQSLIAIPIPFKYGFAFDWAAFIPIAFIYLITAIESTGDLTATSMLSGEPVEGEKYHKRIKGGVLGDGINSLIAAIFNTFPNTTFSQNNGVIQMTGIASRYIGYFIAAIFVILGLFPIIGGLMQTLPKPVLGGATTVLFGSIAAAGIKIIASEEINRKKLIILAASFGLGFGVFLVPDIFKVIKEAVIFKGSLDFPIGKLIHAVFGSAITTAGITAIILTLVLPEDKE